MSPEQDPHALDRWAPELDPSREYCATITAFGDGDLARLPSMSESICASVKQLSSFVDGSSSNDAGPPLLTTVGPQANGCSCTMLANRASKAQWLSVVAAVCFGFVLRRTKAFHSPR